jgi:hypothetical protein
MGTNKLAPSSSATSQIAAEWRDSLFDLPVVSEESCRLMEQPAPTLRQQIAHAQMLIRWRNVQGLGPAHPPRQDERFSF